MFASRRVDGEGVEAIGAIEETPQAIQKVRDLIIVRLAHQGVTQKTIGKIVGLSQSTVCYRLATIPPAVKERYGRAEL